jgi:ribosomal protein S27AE
VTVQGAQSVASARAPSTRFRCGACGAAHDLASWRALSLTGRVAASELQRLVRDWPEAVCIEVRRCTRCGHGVAGKRAEGG